MVTATVETRDRPSVAIGMIMLGMLAVTVQDAMIKALSGDYPLHQIVFARSAVGIWASLLFLHLEGGWRLLKTDTPGLHLLRALLVVCANSLYFSALAVMPLAEANALFFVAPLFITLLSIPLLGESVGPWRISAVVVGFLGVAMILLQKPAGEDGEILFWTALLPVCAAFCYALMQILTRKLGLSTKASALAIYIQGTFLIVSLLVFAVAGDGRFADGIENGSLQFLLRPWVWPETQTDMLLFLGCGLSSAVIGYTLSQAYRIADAATVAPFEYIALPLALLWGWLVWGDWPGGLALAGMAVILSAGLFVFLRERVRNRPNAGRRPFRKH